MPRVPRKGSAPLPLTCALGGDLFDCGFGGVGLLDDLSDDLHELPDRGLEIDVALGFGESLAEIGVLAEVELLEALHLRRIAIALMEQYGNQSSGWRERERVPL